MDSAAEIIVIITAAISMCIGCAYLIAKIAGFYKRRFGFSIFSGVITMILAFSFLYFSAARSTASIPYSIIALVLTLFTIIRDIQLAKVWYGILAFLIHCSFAILSFVIVAFVLAVIIAKKLTNSHSRLYRKIITPSVRECLRGNLLMRYFLLG